LSIFRSDGSDPIDENILKLLNAKRFLIDRMIHSGGRRARSRSVHGEPA
jgi:hypothetical protein